jgi:hypothetical protein
VDEGFFRVQQFRRLGWMAGDDGTRCKHKAGPFLRQVEPDLAASCMSMALRSEQALLWDNAEVGAHGVLFPWPQQDCRAEYVTGFDASHLLPFILSEI